MLRSERESPPTTPAELAPFWLANRVTLIAGAVTAVLTLAVALLLPHERTLTSVWTLLGKLTPYVSASVAIAYLDVAWAKRLKLGAIGIIGVFLVFFCWFTPKIFYAAVRMEAGKAGMFDEIYYLFLLMVPFMILGLLLAFRLGGGSRELTLRLSAVLMLLQLSGIEDLAVLVVNGQDIPEVWRWASHMTVFLGHPPSATEAYVFIGIHLVLAALALSVPVRRRTPPQS